jgi:hypothetical protein
LLKALRNRRPAHALAGGADHAVELQADRALVAVAVLHRRDVPGDQDFDRPGVAVFGNRVLPVAVPVGVELVFVGDGLVLDAVGQAHHEVVADPPFAVEIDVDIDPVGRSVGVALHDLAGARNVGGLRVDEGDRQALLGRKDPDFRRIRRRLARQGLGQAKVGDALGRGPFRLVDPAIDLQRRVRARGHHRDGKYQRPDHPDLHVYSWKR